MAVRGVITEFFDLPEFQKQLAAAKDGVREYIDLVKTTPVIRSAMADPTKIADTLNGMKQLAQQNEKIAATVKVVVNNQRELDKAILEGKISQQEYNKELKQEINLQNAVTGSIKEARAQIALLTKERDGLNLKTEEGRRRAEAINKEIDKQNAFIKTNSSELEKQRLNIGNYQGSAKIIVDALEKARVKVEQVTSSLGPLSPEAKAARAEFEALGRITANPRFLNIAANVGDTNKELGFFQKQLNSLEDAGLKGSQVYNDIRARLAQLTDQIGDTRAEIKALASDTRQFDLFAGSVNFAADAFQTFAGAAVLAGASEEDAAQATKTLVAVQSVANGVKGIANELTTKGTAANLVYAKVQTLVTTTTNASAAATVRLVAAGKLLLATGIIGGIVLLAIHFAKMSRATSEARRQQELLADVMKEAATAAGEEISKLQVLRKVAEDNNIPIKERKKAVDELQEQYPEYFKNIKDEVILQGKAADAYDKTKAAIIENAKARAIESQLAKIAARELEIQLADEDRKKRQFDAKVQAQLNKEAAERQRAKTFGGSSVINPNQFIKGQPALEAVNKEIEEANKELAELARVRDFLLGKITKSGIAPPPPPPDGAKKAKEMADRELQARFEILRIQVQRNIDFNKEIADNEELSLEERLFGLQKYLDLRQHLINIQADTEKKIGEKTATELIVVETKRADEIIRLNKEVADQGRKILEESTNVRIGVTKEEKDAIDKLADDSMKKFEDQEKKKQKAAEETLDKQKELAEKRKELERQLFDELTSMFFSFLDAGLERQKNSIQDQIDLLETEKQKEIEAISQTTASEEDKANKIAVIEARAQANKEQLELRKRRIQQEQAKFEKAANIVKIISDTAASVMNVLKTIAPPASFAIAALVGAIGAAQLAQVIAQPIPKYAKGTDDHPGGPAIVGDGGKAEGVVLPDGTVLKTPSTATLVDLPKGTQVLPDFSKMLLHASVKELPDVRVNIPYDKTERAIRQMEKSIVKTIRDKQENHFHLPSRYDTYMRNGSAFRAYLKDNL